ncbi:MAG: 1-acyl-sn-glycerol-3-phosphate acyltransferase, partial [Thermoanaerobaculia bacterium]|nr:1-acyl-sn-glycerol-3-phosphate acyltransferase [Thermoanaerobaculia bacterium]
GNLATPVYFRWLNTLKAEGDDLLKTLPRKNVVFLSNHQTYFTEAIAFYDLLYIVHGLPYEDPHLRFSAATETMKKNLITNVLTYAGGVTFRRSFREAGKEVNRPVDLEGVGKIEEAIATGWLLHFPTGTTQKNAPIRPGIAQLLHRTKPIAVPMRVDGFQELLLHKQFPGRTGKQATIRLFPPMDLTEFYEEPFDTERGRKVIEEL